MEFEVITCLWKFAKPDFGFRNVGGVLTTYDSGSKTIPLIKCSKKRSKLTSKQEKKLSNEKNSIETFELSRILFFSRIFNYLIQTNSKNIPIRCGVNLFFFFWEGVEYIYKISKGKYFWSI